MSQENLTIVVMSGGVLLRRILIPVLAFTLAYFAAEHAAESRRASPETTPVAFTRQIPSRA